MGAAVLAGVFIASSAQASDGTITINGQIAAQTCTINGGTTGDVTVTLPTVQATAFPSTGDSAGRTNFTIALTNCTPQSGNVSAFFEQGATVDTVTSRLTNQLSGPTAATNVQVRLLNAANGAPIQLNQPAGSQGAAAVPIDTTTGTATLNYAAEYVATDGIPTVGQVSTSVVYSLHYN